MTLLVRPRSGTLRRSGAVLALALAASSVVASSASADTAAEARPVVVDVNSAEQVSNGYRLHALSVTPNGRYVLIGSDAPNMPGPDVDTDGANGYAFLLYRRDLRTGTTVQVSPCPSWDSPAPSASGRTITPDGRYVVFTSIFGCDPEVDDARGDQVYAHDMQTGTTRLASRASEGRPGVRGMSGQPTISDDGRYVAYHSGAPNLSPGEDDRYHVYVHDMVTGTNRIVDSSPALGGEVGGGGSLSGDGTRIAYIAFGAHATYVGHVQDLVTGEDTVTPVRGYLLSRDGRYLFGTQKKGQTYPNTMLDLTTGQLSPSSPAQPGSRYTACRTPWSSSDNRYLAYRCSDESDPDDPSTGPTAVFRRDLSTGSITRVDALPGVKPIVENGNWGAPNLGEITDSGAVLFTSMYAGFLPSGSPDGLHAFLSPPAK